MLRKRLFFEWLAVAILACSGVAFAAYQGWFSAVDNRIYDIATAITAPAADDRILIVEIDDTSLDELGRWPWSRSLHAKAVNTLASYHPKAIAYDVLFMEASPGDVALADAFANGPPVFLPGLIEDGPAAQETLVAPVEPLATGAAEIGISQLLADTDGTLRKGERGLAINGRNVLQLPSLLADTAAPADNSTTALSERFLVSFVFRNSFRRVSFSSLAKGEVPPELVRDKLILVGATAPGMGDRHTVPLAAGSRMSGVEIQANILNTLLSQNGLVTPNRAAMAAICILPLLIQLIAFLRLAPGRNAALAGVLVFGTLLVSFLFLFVGRIWLPVTATVVGIVVVHAIWGWRRLSVIHRFLTNQADRLLKEPGIVVPHHISGLAGDIVGTEALRLEAVVDQVRQLRTFIAGVIEGFPDAVFVVNAANQVMLCNNAAVELVGKSSLGRPIQDVIGEIVSGDHEPGEPIKHSSGRSLVMAEAPVDNGHRIVSFADITEIQRATDDREEMLQFLSHDLRSPNAAIVWLLEGQNLPTEEPGLPPERVHERIKAYARHGLRLADDFVQLVRARRRTIREEAVNLCDAVLEAADMVTAYARTKEITLTNESDAGELWVEGDHSMLVRAAINLLDNAVKFAPDGAEILFSAKRDSDEVVLSVAGPSPALPAERAADPFALYAAGRNADGRSSIGLGLAFVQTTAHRHDGRAHYIYHGPHLTEFQIRLPYAEFGDADA